MESSLFKHVRTISVVAVLAGVVWIGLAGLHRSLWLDEAWVANSLRAGTWSEMWWGGEWLQTSPPAWLALGRLWLGIGGLSTETLRSFSLLFAVVAAGGVYRAAVGTGARSMAPLVAAALVFPTVASEYFFSFKQYGAEAAAVSLVLWTAAEGSTIALTAATAVLLTLAYPLAFLLPGLALLVWHREGLRKAAVFAGVCGAVLTGLYVGFIHPNVEPNLWSYWGASFADAYEPSVWIWIAASVALTAYAAWERNYLLLACALPCVLLVLTEAARWYPASPRMRLFARPCFLVAVAMFAEDHLSRRWLGWASAAAAIAMAVGGVVTYSAIPLEDYPKAIARLLQRVQPEDIVLVHADARQGFVLYAAMEKWDRRVRFGETGWPCCARGRGIPTSSESSVRKDLERLLPQDFRGRVWLVYANRPLHWKFLGLDEGDLWRRQVWDRGCPPVDYEDVGNLVISPMNCTR